MPHLCLTGLIDRCAHLGRLDDKCASAFGNETVVCVASLLDCGVLPPEDCVAQRSEEIFDTINLHEAYIRTSFFAGLNVSFICVSVELLLTFCVICVHAIASACAYGAPHLMSTTALAYIARSRCSCVLRIFGKARLLPRQWVC